MQSDRDVIADDAALCAYDAGLLNDYGGGDVGWWQDYLRAELGRAHDHYEAQFADRLESLSRQLSDAQRERDELRAAVTRAITTPADAKHDMWLKAQNAAFRSVLAMMGNSGHTEGGKP